MSILPIVNRYFGEVDQRRRHQTLTTPTVRRTNNATLPSQRQDLWWNYEESGVYEPASPQLKDTYSSTEARSVAGFGRYSGKTESNIGGLIRLVAREPGATLLA